MEAFKNMKNRLKEKKRDFWRDLALRDDHRRAKKMCIGQTDGERENIKELLRFPSTDGGVNACM